MMNKRNLLTAVVILSAALLLAIGVTTAYLTDVEIQENIITIGKVSIELDETPFDPDSPDIPVVVPGSRVGKAPRLINDGNKDEFVFVKILVPKAEVTLLYEASEDGNRKGTPRAEKQMQELCRLIADDTHETQAVTGAFDVDFTYHNGTTESDGWILLDGSDFTDENHNVYLFGYNKRLTPTDETITLFDEVQLKSFIDGEVKGETEIGVFCYGIQADNLKPSPSVDLTAARLNKAALQAVYTIVANKIAAQVQP